MDLNREDIIWAAGLFEGEGCIDQHKLLWYENILLKEKQMETTKKFDDTNRWKLFRNEEKRSENSPDFSGELNINGELYWMDGWVKEGQTKRFFSGTIKPKKNKTAIDEDVPF